MGDEKFYLALQNFGLERNIAIGLSEVAVPFRDLIFEDEVITKCIPSLLTRSLDRGKNCL
jgi:hypothetical protein